MEKNAFKIDKIFKYKNEKIKKFKHFLQQRKNN